jgi:glycosyltransferase involved in cell wall biosynthesis
MSQPVISIITPTHQREALLRKQHRVVMAQRERNFEWLILDDSPEPSSYFQQLDDPRIRYRHEPGSKRTIGAKRNWLAGEARAPVIAHFDDDDYYAPDYLTIMQAQIARGADIAKLSAWFLYSAIHRQLAYWDTVQILGLHFRVSPDPITPAVLGEEHVKDFSAMPMGFGFSFVYRRAVWEKVPFLDRDMGEDYRFAAAAVQEGFRFKHFTDSQGACLHILHRRNISICFPQYLLPDFMLARFFPGVVELLADQA